MGRVPSGACASRCRLAHARFEAFPAVYRAPGLLGTVLVMNSQGFADGPNPLLNPTHSQLLVLGFTQRRSLRRILTDTYLIRSRRVYSTTDRGSRDFRVRRGLSAGPEVFLLFRMSPSNPFFSIWFYQKAVGIRRRHHLTVQPLDFRIPHAF